MSHASLRMLRSSRGNFSRVLRSESRPIVSRAATLNITRRTASTASTDANSLVTRMKNLLFGTSITLFLTLGYLYATDTRASIHSWLVVPIYRFIYPDAEEAHHAGTQIMKALYLYGLYPRERKSTSEEKKGADLSVTVFGQKLHNPIGTSAGIDKLAEIPDALFALGPAIVEVGGATPFAQEGNPKPRVFRLENHNAMINRYGLNSLGADDMARRLRERVRLFAYREGYGAGQDGEEFVLDGEAGVPPGSLQKGRMLLVQVAKNKDTKDEDIEAVKRDYVYCVERLAPYADVLVVNVSSPNTPGLRTLQKVEPLTRILEGVVGAAKSVNRKTPPRVMVKVSPDEDEDSQMEGIVEAVWKSGVDGVIVGNTTKRRHNIIPDDAVLSPKEREILDEQGGFSGPHMFERTLSMVKRYRRLLDQGPPTLREEESLEDGANSPKSESVVETIASNAKSMAAALGGPGGHEQKVIFATGGITNGKQALEILNAGASVAQIYTAMIYGGAGTVTRIKSEMRDEIAKR